MQLALDAVDAVIAQVVKLNRLASVPLIDQLTASEVVKVEVLYPGYVPSLKVAVVLPPKVGEIVSRTIL